MSPFIRRRPKAENEEDDDETGEIPRLRAKQYMEQYINPPEFLEAQKRKLEAEKEKQNAFSCGASARHSLVL